MHYSSVIIGANDGVHEAFKIETPALLVEPVPNQFEKLCKNHPSAVCVKAAIYNEDKDIDFWLCNKIPQVSGLQIKTKVQYQSSKHKKYRWEKIIVKGITLSSLFSEHSVSGIDTFLVDIEGFDYMVIDQLMKTNIFPNTIYYEYKNFTPIEGRFTDGLLNKFGYIIKRVDECNNIATRNINGSCN